MLQLKFCGIEVLRILEISLEAKLPPGIARIVWFIEVPVLAAFSKELEPRPRSFDSFSGNFPRDFVEIFKNV
jgi:hypothetical protein